MGKIIIEGANGTGKSTLAHLLVEFTGYKLFHSVKPMDEFLAFKEDSFRILGCPDNLILDRCQAISGTIYNGGCNGYEKDIQAYDEAPHVTIIHCIGNGVHDTNKPHYDDALRAKCFTEQDAIKERYAAMFGTIKHIEYDFYLANSLKNVYKQIKV